MSKIDLDKLICSMHELSNEGYGVDKSDLVGLALRQQGLEIKDGEIQEIKETMCVPQVGEKYWCTKDSPYEPTFAEGKEYTVTGYDEVNKLVWLQNPLTQPLASHYLPLSKFNEFFGGYRYQPEEKEVETDLYKPWPRDCYEYVKDNTYHVPNRGPYVYEDTAYEAIDLAKREVAQEIIDLYNKGKVKTVDEILHHCYGIVDF